MTGMLEGLKALGVARLVTLGLVGVVTLGLLGLLSMRSTSAPMVLLYGDLDLREAADIVDQLDRQHIAHQSASGGSQILVPAGDVMRARLLLAKTGLPSGGSIGYEIFDRTDGLTANDFQQHINQLRALEGELARTIRGINGVRSARVHLVLPRREPFSQVKPDAQASVLLSTTGAGRLDRESVQAIVNLVAAAVPGLRANHVTVVDSHGAVLARAGDASGATALRDATEDMRRSIELRIAHAVEDLLERSVGQGRVRAEASVDIDFDHIQETQEKFDPDGQVVRSTQSKTDNSKSTEAPQTVSVQNNLPNADAGTTPAGSQDQRQEETTNYEIGKSVRTTLRDQAQIRRISLAVLVDSGARSPAAGTPPGTQAGGAQAGLSAADVEQLTRLAKTAIGFDQKRGDQVELISMPFATEGDLAAIPAPGLLGLPIEKADLIQLAKPVVVGLIAVLALILIIRPMVDRLTTVSLANGGGSMSAGELGYAGAASGEGGSGSMLALRSGAAQLPGQASPMGAIAGGDAPAMLEGPEDAMIALANVEGQLRASSLRHLAELVEKHPEESLSIVRSWMQQEAS